MLSRLLSVSVQISHIPNDMALIAMHPNDSGEDVSSRFSPTMRALCRSVSVYRRCDRELVLGLEQGVRGQNKVSSGIFLGVSLCVVFVFCE